VAALGEAPQRLLALRVVPAPSKEAWLNDLSNLPPRSKITAGVASCASTAEADTISAIAEAKDLENIMGSTSKYLPRTSSPVRRSRPPEPARRGQPLRDERPSPERVPAARRGPGQAGGGPTGSGLRSTRASIGGASARK
jgi:hypothetical protein